MPRTPKAPTKAPRSSSRASQPVVAQVSLHSDERAERLAKLCRATWQEMARHQNRLAEIIDSYQPEMGCHDSPAAHRMRLKTMLVVLRGYTPDHEQWIAERTACSDRDTYEQIWRFMNEVRDVLSSRLGELEQEVTAFDTGRGTVPPGLTRDECLGPGFCDTLRQLRQSYEHWDAATTMLDSIDYDNFDDADGASTALADFETRIHELEARLVQRRATPS